jgi:hypothetical protein
MESTDIANPLQIHYNFVKYTLTTRHGSNDDAFRTALNEFDFPPAVIFFHGVHALYRMVRMIDQPDLNFREIDMPRKSKVSITEELMELYDEAITSFRNALSAISTEDLEEEIPSPLNGQPIQRKQWYAQSIMHTIHHVGQAVRIQGIIDRKLTNHPVDYKTASDYTELF